jgi:ribulose-phosphate 3-epimerase
MTEIIPAIMPKNFRDIAEKAGLVSSYMTFVQLDLMDGKFVPPKTWPYDSYQDKDFAALLTENAGLPHWELVDYEIDLMSMTPESDVFDWIKAGAKRVILHYESSDEIRKLIGEVRAEFGNPNDSVVAPEIGIAANNDTDMKDWQDIIKDVDFVQVMGIARIGYQGEPIDERAFDRIKMIREKHADLPISVDGSVNADTARLFIEAGATRLVSGSYIYSHENIKEAIDSLQA